jgi:hypothetical protein
MDWIDLAQDRDQWRAVLNTVMNLQIHEKLLSSIPGGARFFSSPQRPDRLWGPRSFVSNGYRGFFGKTAGA